MLSRLHPPPSTPHRKKRKNRLSVLVVMKMGTETKLVGENPRKGGLSTMPFIIVEEKHLKGGKLWFTIQVFNMIIYLMTYYNMSAATFKWVGHCWGHFRAVALGSISTLILKTVGWHGT
ncbi:hypothetical protein H5410_008387 [Solanum commersonii]|uniref:Uncharacterized protein n=1 Tax=Solanum commersonii TaxID=4109 RepID=A0A9J6AFI5_SOLCO|nr:hypothetical protein H5410_008387 [Solanum commersonii]